MITRGTNMVSLARVGRRYDIPMQVIEGGTGLIYGQVTESDQSQIPAYTFVNPRHVFRTAATTPIECGMILRSPAGATYLVGENGPSEQPQGTIWQSFRLFECTGLYRWERRTRIVDPITRQDREGAMQDMGLAWGVFEPLEREAPDRRLRASFEQSRFLSGRPVLPDDNFNGHKVIRSDNILGVYVGVLT